MSDLPKGILVLLIAGVIGSQAFKLLDIDYLAASPSVPSVIASSEVGEEDKEIKAILEGADPTDILAPTAASGKAIDYNCSAGYIVGDLDANRFSEISYASINERGVRYIQVSKYSPSYLVQKQDQVVTATEVDEIPDSIRDQLETKIADPAKCNSMDLYLSSVKYAK